MKKIRKLRAFGIGLAAAAVAITPFLAPQHNAGAEDSSYYNWNQLGTLDEQYAYAKVYRTDDTVITAKEYGYSRASTNADEPTATEYVIDSASEQIVFLLENTTAVDAHGNKVDVILRMDNLRTWKSGGLAYLYFRKHICGTSETITSSNVSTLCSGDNVENEKTLGSGDPIMFWVNADYADVNFSIEFIQKGSYDDATTKGTPVSSIDRLSYATFDYDVKNTHSPSYTSELFSGDEGISLNGGINPSTTKTNFYYQKTDQSSSLKLKEGNDGIAISVNSVGNSYNGIYYSNSAIGIVTGMQDGKYTFRYSASHAGITAFFGSPIKYDTPAPKKYIVESGKTACDKADCSANIAEVSDRFNYVISQTIPDQYSSDVDILTFMSLWSKYPNIPRDHFYTSFSISDTIDSNLTPTTASRIKVYNSANQDVTDLFTVSISNNTLQVTAKSTTLRSTAFYANTFRIVVPVTVNSVVTSANLRNVATTSFQQTGDSEITSKPSGPVTTEVVHNVTVNHISTATGENLADPTVTTYPHQAEYETSALTTLPKGYKLSKKLPLPANAKGVLLKDEVVNYYYDLYYTVTTKHISKTGEELADPVIEEYVYKDDYITEASKDIPSGYVLVEMPKNATGIVDDDIEVIYIYDLAPTPKTFDAGFAPFAFAFTGIGAFIAGSIIFLTRRR